MRILALVTAVEARSYDRKDKTKVEEKVLTCIDWDESLTRLKDSVDITLKQADFTLIKGNPVGQQLWFDVTEIRPNPYSPRMRFTAQLVMDQFQQHEAPPKK